ncbi:MAG: hypothetical protein CM15mP58_12590 [Burkholderiaceae bacterium]|nr:MAG: hypothetical protein CM15mP58_12590 [Burkholderiaceae bacterium]
MKNYFYLWSNFSFTFNAAKAIEELSEIEVVGTSLLPGLEIEEEKLPYEVRSFDSENMERNLLRNY